MMRKTMLGACAGLSLSLFAGAAGGGPADFRTATSTPRSIADSATSNRTGAFTGVSQAAAGPLRSNNLVRGLPLLALLEKRASGNLNDAPQGYNGASEDDKAKMRKAVACILDSRQRISAVRGVLLRQLADGRCRFTRAPAALARARRRFRMTPTSSDLTDAINKLTDDLIAAQLLGDLRHG